MTQPTANDMGLDLPAAVQGVEVSPMLQRIGVVVDIAESDNITVKISGSPVLVTASYLFPQYEPLLGDRVVVVKQDAQWFVLGTMSGPINSAIPNPSFELGTVGSLPTGWTINVLSSGGGVPTFTKVTAGTPVSGLYVADFGVDSLLLGQSSAEVFSPTANAAEGQGWIAAYWITGVFVDNDATTFAGGGGYTDMEIFVQFLDAGGAVLSTTSMNYFGITIDINDALYKRPSPPQTAAVAPAGTVSARIRLYSSFDMHATSFTSWFLDYMILRRVF